MKTREELLAERQDIVRTYQRFTLSQASENSERQFAFFDANLSNTFPELSRMPHVERFKKMHLNRRLSFHDVQLMWFPELIRITGWDEAWAASLRDAPAIVCTYHTGSYRLINFMLARAGVPVSLIVSGQALLREQQEQRRLYAGVSAQTGVRRNVQLIDAEQPKALLQMARAVKTGRTLLVYIDGNTGTHLPGKNLHNLLEIDFGRLRLGVRLGVAALAHRLRLPIYPVRCRRIGMDMAHNREICFDHLPAITCGEQPARQFARHATDTLYQHLASFVKDDPAQWEGWLTLHHQLARTPSTTQIKALEPLSDWAVYRQRQRPYLLHKPSYTHYLLTLAAYHALKEKLADG